MEVSIAGKRTNLSVSTITLTTDDPRKMHPFHCLNCANVVQIMGGKVSKIYPIYEPSFEVPGIARCNRCGKRYTFQTHDGYSATEVSVILHMETELKSDAPDNFFRCYMERAENGKILAYNKKSIHSFVDNKEKTIPFTSPCINPTCSIVYNFTQLI